MRKYGIMVVSHGSKDGDWVSLVREACSSMRFPAAADLRKIPVECVFLELVDGDLIQDGIDRLERQGVTDLVVVPLFISSGSTHIDEISWALGAQSEPLLPTELARFRIRSNVHLCAPIDDDPEIARVLVDKLMTVSVDPSREIVLIVGHGSKEKGFYAKWRRGLDSLAARVKQIGGFAETDIVMLLPDQAACKMEAWRKRRPELDVLISPLFLSEGYFTNRVIPDRFAGYSYQYAGSALLPSPYVTAWMERRIAERIALIELN